jgi:hypothetical protein
MFDPHRFAAADKRSKEARRAERKALKQAKRELRKSPRMSDHTAGHVSGTDPTMGMASKQPPMPAAVARIVGEI